MEPVGVGRRAVAVLIDSILLFIVGYALAALTGQTTATGFNMTGAPFFLWLAISLAYFIVMEATSGATLGKRVMLLKVVKQDGTPMDWQASISRNVLRLIDGFLSPWTCAACALVVPGTGAYSCGGATHTG